MIIECVDVKKISGTTDSILSEKRIDGILDFVPLPNGTGLLLLPITELIIENKRARNEGRIETIPLSRIDLYKRTIFVLTRKETIDLLKLPIGKNFTITRKGWGKTWNDIVKKID